MYCYNNRREPINEDGQKIIALKRRRRKKTMFAANKRNS